MGGTEVSPSPGVCPDCGGRLSEPISGEVHCYVECRSCGNRFDLKDGRIVLA
jgi:hypothetical protein